jgi:hypothetical protein
MKDDPFAALSGLDQKLFAPQSPAPAVAQDKPKTTSEPHVATTEERPDERTPEATSQRIKGRTSGRPLVLRKERPIVRHPYDFYRDQVLWLNRTKVEIEERYGLQVTANAMVQLALDLLILDYRATGLHSHLMTHLVFGRPPRGDAEQGTEGAPNVGTSEGPSGGS